MRARRSPSASFLDELLAPPRVDGVVEALRASGELPEVLAALEAEDPEKALDLVLAEIPDASPDAASGSASSHWQSSTTSARTIP